MYVMLIGKNTDSLIEKLRKNIMDLLKLFKIVVLNQTTKIFLLNLNTSC